MDKKRSLSNFNIFLLIVLSLLIISRLLSVFNRSQLSFQNALLILFYGLIIIAVIKDKVWLWAISLIPALILSFDFRPTYIDSPVPRGFVLGIIKFIILGDTVSLGLWLSVAFFPLLYLAYSVAQLIKNLKLKNY